MNKLDRYDLRILAELQHDARISNQELAERMEVSINTVRFHIKSIYSKLYVTSRAQAVLEASKRGWIRPGV